MIFWKNEHHFYQGQEYTCASHAVGKAVVEILDGFVLDCDQEKIIEKLIQTVQPNKNPVQITDFEDKQIDVYFWEKGLQSMANASHALITIKVQTQTGVNLINWSGPAMTPQQLKSNNTRMVAVWRTGKMGQNSSHAVYVKSYDDQTHKFDCLNSWGGTNNPEPTVPSQEIYTLYFISLHQDNYILVTSAGPSAEHHGDRLGLFREEGTHNNSPYFRQLNYLRRDKKNIFFYRCTDRGWRIGLGLDGAIGLKNQNSTASIPRSGWTCLKGGKYVEDPHVRITADLPPTCGDITIAVTGDAAVKRHECLGVYNPTQMFSMGRKVFKHESQERYLLVPAGYANWGVRESVDSGGWLMDSSCAPSMCPADTRARTSERTGRTSWVYSDGGWKHGDITLKCSVHSKK